MHRALLPGEQVLVRTSPQARSLFWPAIWTIVIFTVAGALLAWTVRGRWDPSWQQYRGPLSLAILVLAGIVLLAYPVRRYLRWRGTLYVLTSRRLLIRRGMLRRQEHDVPLASLSNVTVHQGVLGRLLRSGTVTLYAGLDSSVVLPDVPEIKTFRHLILTAMEALPHSAWLDSVAAASGEAQPGIRMLNWKGTGVDDGR